MVVLGGWRFIMGETTLHLAGIKPADRSARRLEHSLRSLVPLRKILQGCLAHQKIPTSQGHHRVLGIALL